MPSPHRWLGWFAPALLLVLPACGSGPLLAWRDPTPQFPPAPERMARRNDFAVQRLPIAPGESIALRPATPETVEIHHTTEVSTSTPVPSVEIQQKQIHLPTVPPPPAPSLAKVEAPLVAAVEAFQGGNPESAVEHLNAFDKPNQELLLQLIPPVVRVAQVNLSQLDPEEAATLARQFEAAASVLTKRTGLTVRKAVICSNVDGFGRYTPVRDRNGLRRQDLNFVYLEVGNVPCEPFTRRDGVEGFQTRLDVSMQVKDELGQVIEIIDAKTGRAGPKSTNEKVEFSWSPVRDYYVTARLQTPTRPGGYTVTMELRDPKTSTAVSRQIPFRVQ